MKTKFLTIVSLLLLATSGGIASAQSSEAPAELSPAIMKVLCKHFPLNSRCTGEASAAPAEEVTSEEPSKEMEDSSDAQMEDSSDTSAAEGTIVEVASANDSFKTLVAAIQAADLAETLSGEGPFTVFAPSEEAFAALPPGTVDALLLPENKDKLVKILTYHVVPAKAVSTDLESGEVATVAGDPVQVTVEEGGVKVNNASVVQADVMGSNGVIHVIDKVLLPPNL